MAERLTETGMFMGTSVYKIKNGKKSEAVDKLAQLEDIMEEHDFNNIEDLQGFLNFAEKAIKEYRQVRFDRDTWQKACELMGEELDMYATKEDNTISTAQYFYQQAKTEGNDE